MIQQQILTFLYYIIKKDIVQISESGDKCTRSTQTTLTAPVNNIEYKLVPVIPPPKKISTTNTKKMNNFDFFSRAQESMRDGGTAGPVRLL